MKVFRVLAGARAALLLLIASSIAPIGCGNQGPTEPGMSLQPDSSFIPVPGGDGDDMTATSVDVVSAPVTGKVVEKRVRISALLGGTISAGRHTLVIPPLALSRDTWITLRDVTGVMGRVECEALPEGLQFKLPATLITRFSDLELPHGHAIYWIVREGTADEQWVCVGGQLTVANLGISTPLFHFSSYAPGKAGW